ncbi:MAG: 23S rRNA (uracil(1939)-C(5))-methyltransferase RlmD [Azoarcus sp.]|nr:23S rRNA (uracil(1939)-C(5))-methyltransferase RlmD [Azoarcus sp.]
MTTVVVESLDHEARGVAHVGGKAVFIEDALPRETVEYEVLRARPSYEQARAVRILRASPQRVKPRCPRFGVCGGCSLQHLDATAQVAVKQRVMEDAFAHIARIEPEIVFPAINAPAWGYRFRARLGVRVVPSRGGVLIGFHEKRSSHIADLAECPVLPPHVSALLPRLHGLIAALSIADRIPQIEIAVGESGATLVFRHLLPFSDTDLERLAAFGQSAGVDIWRQPNQPDSARPLEGTRTEKESSLAYSLPEFDLRLTFRPTDFTQVNIPANRVLIRRAMQLLDPRPGERIVDLFCGLGNFTLPIARCGATVVGIELADALLERATANARANGLAAQARFHAADLFETTEDSLAALGPLDKLLLDPSREGAIAVVKAISPRQSPPRIVYVSCNPATLARDAAVLVREKGYALRGAGVVNMFPQTSHVETVALFERR